MRSPPRPPHSPDSSAPGSASLSGRANENGAADDKGRPERGTLHLRRPIDARPDAGKPNAGKPDPFQLRAEDLASLDTVPSWLRPFTTTPTSRFTRTPDYLMRPREDEAAPLPMPPRQPPVPSTRLHPPARGPAAPSRRAPPTPPVVEDHPAAEIAATEPVVSAEPAMPVETLEPVMDGTETPASIRRIARLIRTDITAPPARIAEQDDEPLPPESHAERRAEARAIEMSLPDSIAPTILPIEPPLRATVRVSFVWPVDDGVQDEPDMDTAGSEAIELPPLKPQPVATAPARPAVVREAPAASVAVTPVAVAPVPMVPVVETPKAAAPLVAEAPPLTVTTVARPHVIAGNDEYEFPSLELLAKPPLVEPDSELSEEALVRNSTTLQQTLRDFGVRGEIIDANPGPVVTLYELEPAPGTKSSRVIALSADIARSMSAVSARVAVVEGRNVIGIELPNHRRETVWLRELLESHEFTEARAKLGICLGKTIGGESVIVDLAKMPHLLVAGTTGSGKSVAINTMILSLLYQYRPEACRLIMIDPKMLELSVYDGIPHLLTPVVTDPKKAVVALKWAVREMEERYRKMSRLGVRNIDGFNARVAEAREKGEVITRQVATGFDKDTGDITHEEEVMDLSALPYIVVIVDEMADLMMVAGKDIEGAIQRLAQMARAAGIHIVMATQRPSVDVITGTIKANFPTRISFQVTSKIDSRTILGEMGAETLLGQGDMLYMAGGGRIQRVHGPFVSDHEVEKVVAHLKMQARPEYLDAVTSDEDDEAEVAAPAEDGAVFDKGSFGDDSSDAYDQAVAIVLRDKKASTSYIQRRLQIGYNRAASIMERMEKEGIVGPANHAGKREILREMR
ncbi:MAG TPA: DNA translocase FtsK [Kaistia sp.]|nr:DNA translocase FtsK [Kaistia sp.]